MKNSVHPDSTAAERVERSIHALHYKLMRITKPLMLERGLTPPRFQVLLHVMRKQPVHMSELRLPRHVTTSTLTSLVDGLVRDGLVERYRGEEDRRKVFLKITVHGAALLEELHIRARKFLGESLEGVETGEQEAVLRALDSINDRLEEIIQREGIE